MTSQVNPFNIDGTFPVAGQDNDSQGFRDNFTNTRNNFAFVKSELEDLQDKVLLKSALNNTSLDNDLAGSTLVNAQLQAWQEKFRDNGVLGGAQTISFADGNYQRISTGGALTLNFTGWPPNGTAGKLTLRVTVISTAHTVTFPPSVDLGFPAELAGSNSLVVTYPQTGDYYYSIESTDAGASYFVHELGRAANTVQGNLTVTGNIVGQVITSGQIDRGYTYANIAVVSNTISATTSINRVIIDGTATAANANVLLPGGAVDGQVITISSLVPITNTNVSAGIYSVKYVPTNTFQTGNVSVTLLWSTTANAWVRA